MKKQLWNFTNTWVLFGVIIIFAGIFRLILIQYVEFKGDEALNLFLATRPLFHHPFPPASQASSAGILNFPLINYLLFPIVIFTIYPPTVSFVIALINVLIIGGFFLLFAKHHGKLTAFLASIILSLSPWAILYSRKIWAQDFILPLLLLFLWSVYNILEKKNKFWLVFGLSSLLLIQIHQVSGLIPVLFFLFFLVQKRQIAWKKLLLGVVLGLIPALPYFWYMAHTICFSCHDTSFFARFAYHITTGLIRPLQIISIGDFHTELGNDFAIFATHFHIEYLAGKLTYLAYLLLPIGAVMFWIKNKTYRLFVPISIIPVAMYPIIGLQPLMHYYIALLPFFALFVGYVLTHLIQNKKLMLFGIAITLLYFLGLLLFNYGIFSLLAQKGGFAGDYGSGFINSEQSIQTTLRKFKNNPDYQELTLIEPTPLDLFHGYLPVGKMIFPYSQLRNNEYAREKQFVKTPTNPLLQREIFAYYTQQKNPSWDYIVGLKEKSRKSNKFDFIYQTALNEYLETHLKNLYETPDFLLLFPRHWHEIQIENGATLTDGIVAVTITQLMPPVPASQLTPTDNKLIIDKQQTYGTTCLIQDAWCGIAYQPVFLRSHTYSFIVRPVNQVDNTNDEKTYGLSVFEEIINSIRILQ